MKNECEKINTGIGFITTVLFVLAKNSSDCRKSAGQTLYLASNYFEWAIFTFLLSSGLKKKNGSEKEE